MFYLCHTDRVLASRILIRGSIRTRGRRGCLTVSLTGPYHDQLRLSTHLLSEVFVGHVFVASPLPAFLARKRLMWFLESVGVMPYRSEATATSNHFAFFLSPPAICSPPVASLLTCFFLERKGIPPLQLIPWG